MSQYAIEAHNLSKEYLLAHAGSLKPNNPSLRESMAAGLGKVRFRKAKESVPVANEPDRFLALDDVSFHVEHGARLAVIGGNGAGKSTLLKVLCRIISPTTGSLQVRGKVASLLEVGTGFHPDLSGRENIFLNGIILGMTRQEIRRKFDEIVAFAEVERFLDTPVKRYSSGMYMKLAFSVAAHMEPEILIIDEVLAVGDARFQKKCLLKMDEISRKEGRTVLFVSHNMDAISAFCTRGIYLEKGRLQACGPVAEVLESYIGSYTPKAGSFRPNDQKPVFYRSLELEQSEVPFDSELRLRAEVISNRPIPKYTIGLTICTATGIPAGAILLNSPEPLNSGSNKLDIRVPIRNLVPGRYKISASIALDVIADMQDVVWDYPSFEVLGHAQHEPSFSHWHPNWGGIILADATLKSESVFN